MSLVMNSLQPIPRLLIKNRLSGMTDSTTRCRGTVLRMPTPRGPSVDLVVLANSKENLP
jgi:hypothetical protein